MRVAQVKRKAAPGCPGKGQPTAPGTFTGPKHAGLAFDLAHLELPHCECSSILFYALPIRESPLTVPPGVAGRLPYLHLSRQPGACTLARMAEPGRAGKHMWIAGQGTK